MVSVEVALPVYNEERVLAESVHALREYLLAGFPYRWQLVIVDNASTDGTLAAAEELAGRFSEVRYIHLDVKGRGLALRRACALPSTI